jgi:hypothetical protein
MLSVYHNADSSRYLIHVNFTLEMNMAKIALILGSVRRDRQGIKVAFSKDMKYINETSKRGLLGLVRETLSTMYQGCIESINEVQKECWNIHNNEKNDPSLNQWHRMAALNLLRKCSESKFNMFQAAPTLMTVHKLQSQAAELYQRILEDKDKNFHYRNVADFNKDINNGKIPFKDINDLDKP